MTGKPASVKQHDEPHWFGAVEALAGRAFGLALRLTGEAALAEDAVQEAFVRLLRHPPRDRGPDALRAYFLRTVHNTALSLLESETARSRREEVRAMENGLNGAGAPSDAAEREAALAAQQALAELPREMRVAVSLCCEQGLTQREAAAITGAPEGTVARRVQRGLEELHRRLLAAGYAAAAPGALAGTLAALPQPAAPAALRAALTKMVAAGMGSPPAPAGAADTASAALKGGLIVKISLGMAAVGLAAGGVLLAVGGRSEEPAKPASKFSTTATDPGAEWEDKGTWAGIGYRNMGYLDGPRLEAMSFVAPRPGVFTEDGGENIYRTYDPKTDRIMTLAGCGSEGDLDGPFSRTRFGGWGYGNSSGLAGNSRYNYIVSHSKAKGRNVLRRFDFKKRIVESLEVNVDGSATCGFEGGLFLQNGDRLRKIDNDGKLLAEYKLDKAPRASLGPYDPKNDRLYGSSREGVAGWVAWGWDLKAGGKFFGLLPAMREPENQPLRKQCATGPFKGSFFYCPGGLGFGPGDPDYRYLYMGGGDEANVYRLDLEKQEWIKLVPTADKKRWRFGEAPGKVQAWSAGGGIPWANDGTDNMLCGYRGWMNVYERVK